MRIGATVVVLLVCASETRGAKTGEGETGEARERVRRHLDAQTVGLCITGGGTDLEAEHAVEVGRIIQGGVVRGHHSIVEALAIDNGCREVSVGDGGGGVVNMDYSYDAPIMYHAPANLRSLGAGRSL